LSSLFANLWSRPKTKKTDSTKLTTNENDLSQSFFFQIYAPALLFLLFFTFSIYHNPKIMNNNSHKRFYGFFGVFFSSCFWINWFLLLLLLMSYCCCSRLLDEDDD
jgi:hypothetical protein